MFPVTAATLPAWHRRPAAGRYTTTRRPPGRPPAAAAVKALILKMARDNPRWGHERIQGELLELGHRIGKCTVRQIPHDAGVDPAARRCGPTWRRFLATRARTVIATGFPHVDTILLRRVYVLVFIEHHTRRLHLAGISAHPDGAWSAQRAGEFAMRLGRRLEAMRLLIRDRGGGSSPKRSTPSSHPAVCGSSKARPGPRGRTRSASAWSARCAVNCSTIS